MIENLQQVTKGIVTAEVKGKLMLGIRTGMTGRAFAKTKLIELKRSKGLVIQENRVDEWQASEIQEFNNESYLFGPYYEGESLSSVLSKEHTAPLEVIKRLVKNYLLLKERKFYMPTPRGNSLFFLKDEGILFLPDKTMQETISSLTPEERMELIDKINHPDYAGEINISYFLAAVTYKLLTGDYPFTGESELHLHQRIRTSTPLPARYLRPEIKQEVSDKLNSIFQEPIPLDDWEPLLDEWESHGLFREVSNQEKQEIIQEGLKQKQTKERKEMVFTFLKTKWKGLLASIASAAFLIFLITSIIIIMLEPRATRGMTSYQVVNTYFSSINDMEFDVLEDCLDRGVRRNLVEQTTNMNVFSKIRQGYEGVTGIVPAESWRNDGMPEIDRNLLIYGIANLEITRENETTYLVEYEKWEPISTPQADPEDTHILWFQGYNRVERFHLGQDGEYWEIRGIEVLEDEEILDSVPWLEEGGTE
ncbi:MAG: hypothetical protein ACLFR1_11025 [Spirochaetia bacterium]